jgi:hypothetical protein
VGVRAARQLFLVGLALALWSALARPGWLELLGCYLVGLGLTDVALARGYIPSWPARTWLALGVLLCLPGLRFAYASRAAIVEQAGLVGVTERVRDRVRLARSPVIAPGLLSTAQPQSFFVQAADDASALRLVLSDGLELNGLALGEGLFRVDYDPRRDGVPNVQEGELAVRIVTAGSTSTRTLQAASPLVHPRWFCRSPDGARAATLSEETDELIVVDAVAKRIAVGDGPLGCVFVDDHTIVVSHRHAAELWVVDVAGTSRSIPLAGPLGRLDFDAAHNELIVARAGDAPALLHVVLPELTLRASTQLSAAADWLALSGESLLVSSRSDASLRRFAREGERWVERAQLSLGRAAATLAVDGQRVYVSVTDYRPAHSPAQLGNHFVQDQLLVIDVASLSVQQRVLTARRSERQTKPGDVDGGGSPLGLWPLRDGRLAVSFAGTDELWRVRLPEVEPVVLRFEDDAFHTPHAVVELADGTLWLASAAAGALAKLAPEAREPVIVSLAAHETKLALARRIGERGFYESTRSGISCQSCHMHADSDFAAYNLGDHRLVPTLSVAGLLGTAPYLRDGSYPRIGDLDDVAQGLYRGYVRQQPGRRYALQAYVEALPRLRVASRDEAAERRGYAVFQQAGCARCHSPPAFTNLGQLPLAALFPRTAASITTQEQLDVPSLLSVSLSPPYLHDGRAASLRAVLTDENPDNLHGNTRKLSETEQQDLLQFLGSL